MKRNKVERSDGVVEEIFEYDEKGKYKSTKNIIFTDKKGNKIDLAELLPEGWKFSSADKSGMMKQAESRESYFNAEIVPKLINYGKLKDDGRLFALLHEIGHAVTNKELAYTELCADEMYGYAHNPENQKITHEEVKKRGENPDDYVPIDVLNPENNHKDYIKVLVPKDIVDKFAKAASVSERSAHAYALGKIRDLRQKGLDIEANKSWEDIRNEYYSILEYAEKMMLNDYGLKTNYFTKNRKFEKIENVEENYKDK